MVEGNISVKELDTYQEPGKLLGSSGTGKVTVSKQEYANMLLKENKPAYTVEVNERFFGGGCESCTCGTGGGACAKG